MEELKEYFSHIKDLERISSRISLRKATPRDLIALKDSLEIVPYIIESVKTNLGISSFFDKIDPLGEVKEIIEKTICEEPSIEVGSGEVIKEGVSNELDEYRNILKTSTTFLKRLRKEKKN